VDVTPSRMTAPAASETSSECSITGKSREFAVIHDLTGELGGRDGFSIVRHCDDARFFHCSDFRDSFAFTFDARGAYRPNAR